MKVVIMDNGQNGKDNTPKTEYHLNKVLEWFIYMLGYALVLTVASNLFSALYIENFWYGFLAAIIIYILNRTIKPFLVTVSLPLIGVSLGLFYFVINVFILVITHLILGKYFSLTGIFSPFIISIFISITNIIMEQFIIKPLIEKCRR